ncbi:MAG TPA: prephenate dehydrogenase [Lutibacter sp.]|nr:prephenate dehydrogenase [Lutibacter sp.]
MKQINNITIIGLGLLGGSMGLALKKRLNLTIYGIDNNPKHIEKALQLGLIDQKSSFDNIQQSDVVIIAVPVNKIPEVTLKVLNVITENTLVFDVGSTKHNLCKTIESHPKRGNFVAAHPIAGTEFSGPEAAFDSLFENKKNIVCNASETHPSILEKALTLFKIIGLQTDFMESESHDKHIAYVSHLSHISSFMLGKTVMQIEKDEQSIFNMAGSGFESTVRLAKSSPETWTPIFLENKTNISIALGEYIRNLQAFKMMIDNEQKNEVYKMMKETNHIKDILKS